MNTATDVTAHVTFRRGPYDTDRPENKRAWLVAAADDERHRTYGWTLAEARRNITEVVAI